MRLAALSYGYGVSPLDLSGRVVGLFARACEVLRPDGFLVTLVAVNAGNLPGGIVVDTPAGFDFRTSVAEGAEAAVRGGILRFAGSSLAVDLRAAHAWCTDLERIGLDLGPDAARAAWLAAARCLREDGRAAPLLALAGPAIAALTDASRRLDAVAARRTADGIVGLGDGVTPAGDDCLVGHLAGLWASAGSDPARRAYAAELGAAAVALAPRTHRASRAYLEAAAAGETSERLAKLVSAIAAGAVDEARMAAAAAIAVGHSSGACGVLGLLNGAAAWGPPGLTIEAPVADRIQHET